MSTARRKEKIKAGLDGLFSQPAAKKPAPQTETPPANEPSPLEPEPLENEPAEVDEPVAAVAPVEVAEPVETDEPVEIEAAVAPPAKPAPVVEADPGPKPAMPVPDEPPPAQKPAPAPASPRPVIKKTNGASGYTGHSFGQEEQVVVFTIDDEYYAVDIAVVESIIKMQEITAIPNAPVYVEGVINLRGSVLPIIDLRTRLEIPNVPPDKETRIVVIEINDDLVGCVVDAVTEVLRIPADRVEPPSGLIVSLDSAFIRGVAKIESRLIIMLDVSKLLVLQ